MKLGELAVVRSGLVLARKQSRDTTEYRYKLLNLRSVKPAGYIDVGAADIFYAAEPLNPEYLSHEGDVVIRLSTPYTAVLIDSATSGMVVSSYFVIVRPDPKCLLSGYLCWLLNTPGVKRRIFENTSSNMIGAINPRYFADFEVIPLSIEDQKKISELNRLAHRECQLLNELAAAKEKYYSLAINEIQKQMRRGIDHDDKR